MKRVERLLSAYPKAMPKVMSRGINNTAKPAKTRIIRELAKKTKVKQKIIRPLITHKKATYKSWYAHIGISGQGVPVSALEPEQTQTGVTYLNPLTGIREEVKSAFIAKLDTGHVDVFIRKALGDYAAKKLKPGIRVQLNPEMFKKELRLPIKMVRSWALSDIYEKSFEIVHRIQAETEKDLTKNIMTQVRLVLAQAK